MSACCALAVAAIRVLPRAVGGRHVAPAHEVEHVQRVLCKRTLMLSVMCLSDALWCKPDGLTAHTMHVLLVLVCIIYKAMHS